MGREAFLPLFFGDLLASTVEWEGEEVSLYVTALGHQWSLGSLPNDPGKVCRLVRWERKNFDRYWPQVAQKFEVRDGRLINARLEEHRARAAQLSEKNANAGKKGAAARWRKGGERHEIANGENIANATEAPMAPRHESANGVTHGNPSHPIPIQEKSPPTPLSGGVSEEDQSRPAGEGTAGPAEAWRDVTECDREAYEAWLAYRDEAGDTVPPSVRIQHAKFLAGKGKPEEQRAFVAELIRRQFKRLHDPFHRETSAPERRREDPFRGAQDALEAYGGVVARKVDG